MEVVIFLVFLIAVILLQVTALTSSDGQTGTPDRISYDEKMERWEGMADRCGLEDVADYPREHLRLEGDVRGEQVTVRRTSGAGEGATVFEVSVEGLVPDGFSMSPRGAPEVVDSLVDAEDVLLGNERLDSPFVFQGMREREVKEFAWRDGVEEHLLAFADLPDGSHIEDGLLRCREFGEVPPVDTAVDRIEQLAAWAETLRELVEESDESEPPDERPEGWVAPE